MNSTIYKTLKDSFKNASNVSNSSIIELCITELSSENYAKAIELSEELIKKDINDSVGWAMKALAQSNMFDYQNNLFYLKSSLTSLDEFRDKTTLSQKEIQSVDAIFTIAFLDRTIQLVNQRLEEVIELRRQAMAEKAKAKVANFSAVFSGYMGSKSTSDVGKIIGYGGAVAGAIAGAQFKQNANLLNDASKGIFGVAIANISVTIDKAVHLKSILNELDNVICLEATTVLHEWIEMLAFLYQQVVENLLVLGSNIERQNSLRKSFRNDAIQMINTPEVTQFIYLSKVLGVENSIPQFSSIEDTLFTLKSMKIDEINASVNIMKTIIISCFALWFISVQINTNNDFDDIARTIFSILILLSIFSGIGTWIFFSQWPIGKVGILKKTISKFVYIMTNFKIKSNQIIIENIKY